MKKGLGLLTKVLSVVLAAALVLGTSGVKAYAADAVSHNKQNSPEYSTTKDMDMVFSVRKQLQPNDDLTENGNIFDGKPIGEYHQIHTNTAETGDNGRYSTPVSGAAVSAVIGDVLNAYTGSDKYTGAHNINETMALSGNGDQSVLAEEVLKAVLGEDDYDAINLLADEYIRARLGLTGNKEAIVSIDWYVIKHQKDGRVGGRYHVDGNVTVTYKEYEDWTVVYNFEQKDADPEKIALEDKITVEKDVTPSFSREEIMAPSDVDSKFEGQDELYTLRTSEVDEEEIAVVNYDSENKTIEIYYDLAREEWIVAYTFEMKDADPERIELEDRLVVFLGDDPEFNDDDILAPSAVAENFSDKDYVLTLNEDGTKFELTGDKTIEIRYELVKEDPTTEDPTTEDPTTEDPTTEDPTNEEPVNEDPTDDDPKQDDTNDIPLIIIPPVINNDPETKEEPKEELPVEEPVTPEGTPEDEETVEEIPVEEPGTPEGAPVEEEPVEEIPVEEPGTPEGAPVEEEEDEIPVDIPATPEGDVLPQTGVASAAAFFGFGAAFIGLGAFAVLKAIRKEEI